jgi:hypothetical protein
MRNSTSISEETRGVGCGEETTAQPRNREQLELLTGGNRRREEEKP